MPRKSRGFSFPGGLARHSARRLADFERHVATSWSTLSRGNGTPAARRRLAESLVPRRAARPRRSPEIMEARAQLGVSSATGAVTGPIGAFPIQTPVEPTGKYAVQANTLTATITFHRHGHRHARQEPALRLRMPPNDGSLVDANILGKIVLASTGNTRQDDKPIEHIGMGGQGVLPIPLVYNGWVQNVPTGVIAHAFESVLGLRAVRLVFRVKTPERRLSRTRARTGRGRGCSRGRLALTLPTAFDARGATSAARARSAVLAPLLSPPSGRVARAPPRRGG